MKAYRILVADDDEDDFDFIKSVLLELNPHSVIERAVNGKELIDHLNESLKAQKPVPDLILLDINMPKVNGFQALARIKSKKEICSIPTLMYSTSACYTEMEKCYVLGADGFITKSHCVKKTNELAKKIYQCLDTVSGFTPGAFSRNLQRQINP